MTKKKIEAKREEAELEEDKSTMETKKKLFSLGEKGFFLILFLSAFLLLAWIFS